MTFNRLFSEMIIRNNKFIHIKTHAKKMQNALTKDTSILAPSLMEYLRTIFFGNNIRATLLIVYNNHYGQYMHGQPSKGHRYHEAKECGRE